MNSFSQSGAQPTSVAAASTGSPDCDTWTPGEVLEASGGLLAHLARTGIRFLPQADPAAVERWSGEFSASSDHNSAVSESDSVDADSDVEKRPVPGKTPDFGANPVQSDHAAPPRRSPSAPAVGSTRVANQSQGTSLLPASTPRYEAPLMPIAQRSERLDALAQTVAGCTRCKVLASCRTQTVFGEGNPQPRFVFFGEGPGAEEDKSGRPFVGQAGRLLTKMIEAIHLKREEVYILNTVKCRPPDNRNPERDEIANCREYFEAQLDLLQPEYIICLGAVASQALLDSKLSIGRLRQQFHSYRSSKVLVIYHPAYLLRNPDAKKAAWADLQLLMKDAAL